MLSQHSRQVCDDMIILQEKNRDPKQLNKRTHPEWLDDKTRSVFVSHAQSWSASSETFGAGALRHSKDSKSAVFVDPGMNDVMTAVDMDDEFRQSTSRR